MSVVWPYDPGKKVRVKDDVLDTNFAGEIGVIHEPWEPSHMDGSKWDVVVMFHDEAGEVIDDELFSYTELIPIKGDT
jgi:hypothetical protein